MFYYCKYTRSEADDFIVRSGSYWCRYFADKENPYFTDTYTPTNIHAETSSPYEYKLQLFIQQGIISENTLQIDKKII